MTDSEEKAIGRLEGKMDMLIDHIRSHSSECDNRMTAVEKSIVCLKQRYSWAEGVKSSVLVGVSFIGGVLALLIAYFGH